MDNCQFRNPLAGIENKLISFAQLPGELEFIELTIDN